MKTYTNAIDDCIEVLSQIYEKHGNGKIYNQEIKENLERLKANHYKEIDEAIGPIMNLYSILNRANVPIGVIEKAIDEFKKYKNSVDTSSLPMWRKRDDFDYPTHFCGVVISGGQTTTLPVVIADGYEIPLPELLNKLPKEK